MTPSLGGSHAPSTRALSHGRRGHYPREPATHCYLSGGTAGRSVVDQPTDVAVDAHAPVMLAACSDDCTMSYSIALTRLRWRRSTPGCSGSRSLTRAPIGLSLPPTIGRQAWLSSSLRITGRPHGPMPEFPSSSTWTSWSKMWPQLSLAYWHWGQRNSTARMSMQTRRVTPSVSSHVQAGQPPYRRMAELESPSKEIREAVSDPGSGVRSRG